MNSEPNKLTKEHHAWLSYTHKSHMLRHLPLLIATSVVIVLTLTFAVITRAIVFGQGSRPFAAVETETGSVSGGAAVVSDANAAGARAIIFRQATTSTPSPTPSPAPSPSPTSKVRRFPGDPNPKLYGKAYWGSSIGGNGSPSRHEDPTGVSLSIRRTFWQWSNADNPPNDSLFTTVKNDLAANRLPFVSIKTPGWKAVADGNYDSVLDAMLRQLDSYGKPVWLSVHHEPEGGGGDNFPDDPGGAYEWRRMQSKIRARMNAVGTKNVAFMPILMSYTWNIASGRNPADWWVPGIWDAYCVDHYRDNISGNMFTAQWTPFVSWVEAKGLPFCVGEWGNRGTDAQAATEMQQFWDWTFTNKKDMIGYAYFDSGLNSPSGSWELTGEPLIKFRSILKSDIRVQRVNSL